MAFVNAALACRSCSWFGVYRTDVAHSLTGCPNCGADALVVRDLEDAAWPDLGAELLRGAQPVRRAEPPLRP